MSEWFYLQYWKESSKNIWAVIDVLDSKVYAKNLTKREAESHMCQVQNVDKEKLLVINMEESAYNDLSKTKEEEIENH